MHKRTAAVEADSSSVIRHSSFLSWIGAAGIVSIAVMRCCIVFAPQLVFDSDPALDSSPIAALGMGGSLLLDAALILACLFALVGEWRSGRGLDPVLLVLALLPAPIILWHGYGDAGDLWRGSTWLAAAIACVSIAHLARERTMRIILTAALVAVVGPLLIRGAIQMTWEHDATVETYKQNREVFLRMRGWDADSPAARIYERRLMNREPTGWFPSTNIYGSMIGAAAITFAGLGWCAFAAFKRKTMQSGAWFLLALLVVGCLVALRFTTSMGAALATVAGALALIALMMVRSSREPCLPRWAGTLMLVMIFGATAGVIVRGAILPEGFLGEKSLLFRWHYLQAAVGIVSDHHLLGVGPDGFQVAYTQHRPSRNPEEVQSAHAMFTDWIAMLGFAGGAWIAMIITLIVRRAGGPSIVGPPGRGATSHTHANQTNAVATTGRAARLALAVVAIGIVPAVIIEWPALADRDLFMRGVMSLSYIALAAFLASALDICESRSLRVIAAAAATVLLVHGQIEMTFFQGGSVVWALAMVGLIGSPRGAISRSADSVIAALCVLALVVVCGWIVTQGALPALAQERQMRDAARLLDHVRNNPGSMEIVLRQRPLAAEALVTAYETWPISPQPLNAAAEQLMLAADALGAATRPAEGSPSSPPIGLLVRAEEIIDRAVAAHQHPSSIVLAMNVHANLAAVTDDAEQWTRAIALGRRMTDIDPHGVGGWQRLGRALWAAGARAEAADAFRTAIANSDNFNLDPMKQLSDAVRAELLARIAEASNTHATNPQ